jgi:hypothetical protein
MQEGMVSVGEFILEEQATVEDQGRRQPVEPMNMANPGSSVHSRQGSQGSQKRIENYNQGEEAQLELENANEELEGTVVASSVIEDME